MQKAGGLNFLLAQEQPARQMNALRILGVCGVLRLCVGPKNLEMSGVTL